jgi:thioredoxin reductase (NADPH)
MEKVIIIGSGPAGLTAAIYTARADFKPLCLAGYAAGGQLMTTTEVENYPGFQKGIQGPELMTEFREQALRFGTQIKDIDVTSVDLKKSPFVVTAGKESWETQAVIIATGAQAKLLGLEKEKKLMGRGVSTCATCDGAFFRDQDICIIGGGDTAMEEATFLTRFAKKVYVIHRRDKLRASKAMQNRAFANKKIEFLWNSTITEIHGEKDVESVTLENTQTKEKSQLKVTGVFVAIGHKPTTDLFKDQVDLDENGYIKVTNQTHTNIPGVFVAGDVQDHRYRQAVTAAGMGCMAALDAQHYLENLKSSS